MNKNIVYASAWVATGIAVSVAIYVTKNSSLLWGMLLPFFLTLYDEN